MTTENAPSEAATAASASAATDAPTTDASTTAASVTDTPVTDTPASASTAAPAPTRAVTGEHTTDGMPHGSTSLTPHLVVSPGAAAIDFYRDVFGARVVDVTRFPSATGGELIAHAVLDLGTGMLTLSDPLEEYGLVGAAAASAAAGGHSFSLAIYLPDVDAATAAAEAAGATIREQPATFVSGDRFASVVDPFGVRWSIMTRVEDLSPEEGARRVAEWAAGQQG